MGVGDEIMASGVARETYEATGGAFRVSIVDAHDRARWSEMWENLDFIAPPHAVLAKESVVRIRNCSGHRPYISSWGTWQGRPFAMFSDWHAQEHKGVIRLSKEEQQYAEGWANALGPYVVIEPTIKGPSSPNKQWPRERFQKVVDEMFQVRFVQLGTDPSKKLAGVRFIRTETFREAAAILSKAIAYLGPEGGLHHAAGVIGVPGVVIFGGFISPRTTGYDIHNNLYVLEKDSPCGRWASCPHCKDAMDAIGVKKVCLSLQEVLDASPCG